jgi:hypothetical protein
MPSWPSPWGVANSRHRCSNTKNNEHQTIQRQQKCQKWGPTGIRTRDPSYLSQNLTEGIHPETTIIPLNHWAAVVEVVPYLGPY